jgi:ABC-2 type transport system permease protein
MQGYHSVMNVLLFPMWLLSGAVFPSVGAFGWIRSVMAVNPLTYALSALRYCLCDENTIRVMDLPSLSVSLVVTLAFGLAVFGISLLLVQHMSVRGME